MIAVFAVLCVLGIPPTPDNNAALPRSAGEPFHWCRTKTAHGGEEAGVAGGCPTRGLCDTPAVRDSWIPDADPPLTAIRLKIHIFANDDGTNAVATPQEAAAQVAHLNQDFAPSGFAFVEEIEVINSSAFRNYTTDEEFAMKLTYADAPAVQLNVYVVNNLDGYSMGTFPWDSQALGPMGGIIMTAGHFGPTRSIFAHEVGHNLGLWHTHHGVSEVGMCSACYERADGMGGDVTGDFCGDTDPTPVNWSCNGPGGDDACSSTPWGDTDWQNFMGYASQVCYTEFSPHQIGRQRCWFDAVLTSWSVDCELGDGSWPDCNDNDIPDDCEADFDEDGTIDGCDDDIDGDGVPNDADICDYTPVGVTVKADGSPRSDIDGDCDVDLWDHRHFERCISPSGPGTPPDNPWCTVWFDHDDDDDIDIRDYAAFLGQFTDPPG